MIVSHIEDPGEFYVQYSTDHQNLTVLMTQLAEHCNNNPTAISFNNGKNSVKWLARIIALQA